MLLNLLPGLRDLRAPLAAGYLWLAAGWLYFAPQLPASANETQGILQDIYRVVHASGPVAVGAGLTFAAYIIGILSAGILTRPIRFILRLPLIIIVLLVSLVGGFLVSRWPSIEDGFESLLDRVESWQRDRLSSLSIGLAPSNRVEKFVVDRLSSRLLGDRELRDVFFERLNKRLHEVFSQRRPPYRDELYPLRRVYSIRSLLDSDFSGFSADQRARQVLGELSHSLDEGLDYLASAQAIVRTVVDVNRHARDVGDELKVIPERLVSDKPQTYERWDRLSAEGEFRQAIVPPSSLL
jgi:hypothetical protein